MTRPMFHVLPCALSMLKLGNRAIRDHAFIPFSCVFPGCGVGTRFRRCMFWFFRRGQPGVDIVASPSVTAEQQ